MTSDRANRQQAATSRTASPHRQYCNIRAGCRSGFGAVAWVVPWSKLKPDILMMQHGSGEIGTEAIRTEAEARGLIPTILRIALEARTCAACPHHSRR